MTVGELTGSGVQRAGWVRSVPVGALFAGATIVATVALSLWVSGPFEAFSRNRGFLQLVLAVPFGLLAVGALASAGGALSVRQALWGLIPVEVLVVLVSGIWLDWQSEAAVGALVATVVICVPWTVGTFIGAWLRGRRRPPK